ncbi:MAG TPA: ATP-dependent Clp protease proteolytic subunit [Stellaceae bacterium]|nr:ATP-dependent Clp protease proteolytic subunit [Stellaceae bacterium]
MIIPIVGELSFSHVASVRRACAAAPREALKIIISSNGGDLRPAFALVETIQAHGRRAPTVGRVARRCDSAAILVLSACQQRQALSTTRIHMHEAERDAWQMPSRMTASSLRQTAAELLALDERCRKFIAQATGADAGELALLDRVDCDISGREALRLGILTMLLDDPDATEAARARRAMRAPAQQHDTRPGPWTPAHLRAMAAAGMIGRPLLISHSALRRILEQ